RRTAASLARVSGGSGSCPIATMPDADDSSNYFRQVVSIRPPFVRLSDGLQAALTRSGTPPARTRLMRKAKRLNDDDCRIRDTGHSAPRGVPRSTPGVGTGIGCP